MRVYISGKIGEEQLSEATRQKFAKAEDKARVIFITGSGTASMEASVMNTFTHRDKVLVVYIREYPEVYRIS